MPTKRARTARKDKTEKKEEDSEDEQDVHACQKCGKNDHPEWILLCDKCDKGIHKQHHFFPKQLTINTFVFSPLNPIGYHCSCLIPVLFVIPEGNWFCPLCQQDQLIDELVSKLDLFDARVRQKEADEAQRQRILLTTINEANVLKDTKRDRQRARAAEHSESSDSSDDSSSEDSDASEKRRPERGERKTRRPKPSRQRKRSESSDQSSDSDNTSDDEPIYKFRKRRQANVSYRFNEYDELINRAIKSEMDEVAGAGNLGRGKDISTIIEADKEKKRLQQLGQEKDEKDSKGDDNDESDDEPLSKQKSAKSDDSDSEPLVIKRSKNAKKKKKLNSLDSDTEEDVDQSDDDFKASVSSNSGSDDDEENSEVDTDSSSDSLYRKKKKKAGRMSRRRSGRERKKRFDADFIDDDSFDDDDDIPLAKKKKKKKKAESDYSDFNDTSEEELEEDVDSDDLCDDSSDDSDKPWSSSRKKSKAKSKPKPALGGKVPRNPIAKAKKPKKKPKLSDDDSDSNEVLPKSRRTRGKKTPYMVDDDFDSSDDGIRPGVKRPDTPPEEREAFIKKQEEIKRKLAEQKKDDPALNVLPQANDSLSTIPAQIIQSAKALDIDLKKSAILNKSIGSDNDSNAFDDDLPEDFDPEEMDEDAIAKMMEEEEFAQQQLKLAGETIRNKKQKDSLLETPKKDDKISLDIASSVIMPNIPPSLVSPLPFGQSLTIPDIPPSMYVAQVQVGTLKTVTTPKKRGRKKDETPTILELPKPVQDLASQFMAKDQPLPPMSTIQHTSVLPPHTKSNIPLTIPTILPPHGLPPQLYSTSAIQHTSSVIAHSSSAIPPQRPLPSMMQMLASSPRGMMSSSLMDVQNTKLMDAAELAKPPDDLFESPTKKRGRRKKITPTRDSLQSPPAALNVTVTSMLAQQPPTTLSSAQIIKSPSTSILSERLTGNLGGKNCFSFINFIVYV